jgi:hypothetical protein
MKMEMSEEYRMISKANKIRLILIGIFLLFFLSAFILQIFFDVTFVLAVILSAILTTLAVLVIIILRKYSRRK